SLPGGEQNLPGLIPRRTITNGGSRATTTPYAPSTSASDGCKGRPCRVLSDMFPRDVLVKAIMERRPTAWRLDGKALLDPSRPYMAISHVWSDGTGAGLWGDGYVNECLYKYFSNIAEQLGARAYGGMLSVYL